MRFATAEAGIRYKGRTDLCLPCSTPGTTVAGVLTQSKTRSAPVDWCREEPQDGRGARARRQFRQRQRLHRQKGREAVAHHRRGCGRGRRLRARSEVFIASTGVIGEPLDAGKFAHLLDGLADGGQARRLGRRRARHHDHRHVPQARDAHGARSAASRSTINGFCKGAGMIAPDMATMLCFVFTDAAIAARGAAGARRRGRRAHVQLHDRRRRHLDQRHAAAVRDRRRGRRAAARASPSRTIPRSRDFAAALHDLMRELAILVAKDGEGLTKFVTIEVAGAEDDRAARTIGLSIANSPLVKTAIAGEDPNWGRIVMAVGKAGEAADRDRLVDLVRRRTRRRARASARRATRRRWSPRYMKRRGDRRARRRRRRQGARPRCGPAT